MRVKEIIHEDSTTILRHKMEELLERIQFKLLANRDSFSTKRCSFFVLLRALEDLEKSINECTKDVINDFRNKTYES